MGSKDTEITLGTGKILGLFFLLVILCAGFFGFGYSMGRSAQPTAGATGLASLPLAVITGHRPPADKPVAPAESTGPIPATNASGTIFVQVAAVRKQDDAEALVAALRQKDYAAFSSNAPTDQLFHVQIGPFVEAKDAEAVRNHLVSDGYNPIVKK